MTNVYRFLHVATPDATEGTDRVGGAAPSVVFAWLSAQRRSQLRAVKSYGQLKVGLAVTVAATLPAGVLAAGGV
jgi:hypothetical protein